MRRPKNDFKDNFIDALIDVWLVSLTLCICCVYKSSWLKPGILLLPRSWFMAKEGTLTSKTVKEPKPKIYKIKKEEESERSAKV